jgi:transketolase
MTTGSLGQGASTACGMALGLKLSGKDSRVYLILGDVECQEGQVWEMALFAAQHKLATLSHFLITTSAVGWIRHRYL